MAEEDNRLFTTKDMAEMFNLSPQTIKNWCPQLPPMTRTKGGHRRYTAKHIDALKKLLTPESQPPTTPPVSEAAHVDPF